ncbi:unnamed protein product [Caenorhabditis bovis]|uniref:3-dehydrosphinganine reductase n=1 Tax=Caenorhabditis bovis TaxID=2654633 RepID=A0A8S1F4S0_9PELO|nr:unnamed protein product [Caenorhabditis bovis]
MGSNQIEADYTRLGVKIELPDKRSFTINQFEQFVNEAVREVFGTCGPIVKVSEYIESQNRGSVIATGSEIQQVWAALSSKGLFRGYRIAAHFHINRNRRVEFSLNKMGLVFLVFIPIIGFVIFLVGGLVLYFSLPSRRDFFFYKKHAVVTGGSKGIGFQLAAGLIERGCNVTIIARNVNDLKKACESLEELAIQRGQNQKVQWKSLDLTSNYEQIKKTFDESAAELGPIEILINNAGHSVQAPFSELPVDDFEKQMKINYLSAVYASRAVVEDMKSRKSGHISFVSSAAGQFAIFGYTAYSPTKFALRGFADALHMELLPYRVNVGVLYPPNTDTEGFKVEIETMPEETKLISDSAGLFTPKFVAEAHLNDIADGNYATTIGLDGWMLGNLTAGASPEKSLPRAIVQAMLAGIFRAITLVYLGYFNGIVKRCHRRKLTEEEEKRKARKRN